MVTKPLRLSSAQMVQKARSRIQEVNARVLVTQLEDPSIVLVDLREFRERQRDGFIPGSVHVPRGMVEFWIDPESPYFKELFAGERKFIFYCASGWRSALTVATLQDMGFEASHLQDGFSSWKESGGEVEHTH